MEKKYCKKTIIKNAFLVLMLSMLFVGCSKDTLTNSKLKGDWLYYKLTVDRPNNWTNEVWYTLTFEKDNTFTMSYKEENHGTYTDTDYGVESGTYSIDDSKKIVRLMSIDGEVESLEIIDNELVSQSNKQMRFKKK